MDESVNLDPRLNLSKEGFWFFDLECMEKN